MALSTKDVANIFNFAEPTVRKWAVEFAEYLSPTATPGDGKKRSFTVEDLAVIDLIAEYKNRNATFEDIHFALRSGARGMPPDLSDAELKLISATESEKQATIEMASLKRQIMDLSNRLERAEKEAADALVLRTDNARLGATVDSLQTQLQSALSKLDDLQQENKQLNREVGESRGQAYLDGYKAGLKDAKTSEEE